MCIVSLSLLQQALHEHVDDHVFGATNNLSYVRLFAFPAAGIA